MAGARGSGRAAAGWMVSEVYRPGLADSPHRGGVPGAGYQRGRARAARVGGEADDAADAAVLSAACGEDAQLELASRQGAAGAAYIPTSTFSLWHTDSKGLCEPGGGYSGQLRRHAAFESVTANGGDKGVGAALGEAGGVCDGAEVCGGEAGPAGRGDGEEGVEGYGVES